MKLAIDLQACQTASRERGIGRYALGLATALDRLQSPGFELTVLLDSVMPCRLADARRALRMQGVDPRSFSYHYPSHPGFTDAFPSLSAGAGLLKSRFVESLRPDVLLVTNHFDVGEHLTSGYDLSRLPAVHKVAIAYDLIPLLFPDRYLPAGSFIERWYRGRLESLKQFDSILAISESTRDDLVRHLGFDRGRIAVIDAGIDGYMEPAEDAASSAALLRRMGVHRPFVLMVGNTDWRKNCIGAVEIFARLPERVRETHQLVFTRVGPDVHSALEGQYQALGRNVLMLGGVDDRTLAALYASCRAFLFPSLYEGFGLPVLEAMAAGAPVLCANRGALPEVMPSREAMFDPDDFEGAARALERALVDDDFRRQLLDGARAHAQGYTWERSARLTLDALLGLSRRAKAASVAAPWQPSAEEVCVLADAVEQLPGTGFETLRTSLTHNAGRGSRRVLVDVSEVVRIDARSGIQRVVRNLVGQMVELAAATEGVEVVPFACRDGVIGTAYRALRETLEIECPGEDESLRVQTGDIALMLDSSWWEPQRFDAFHSRIKAEGGEVIWVVYDLVPVLHPEVCVEGMSEVFTAWLQHVARTADGCICISMQTQRQLRSFFAAHAAAEPRLPWLRHMRLGSDLESGRNGTPSAETLALIEARGPDGYAVALSTIEPRKDYPTILAAFEELWSRGSTLSLVIIGKQGWNVDALCERLRLHPEFGRRLHWQVSATDGDVLALLQHARCLVQASVAEGYGLAVVEAGSLGVPLVLSDIPVFREVAGDQAEYFPVGDAPRLAQLLLDLHTRQAWREPALAQAPTWNEASRHLLRLLLGVRSDPSGIEASSLEARPAARSRAS